MAEQSGPGKHMQDLPPLFQETGLLEQFNLPPRLIRFLRRYQRALFMLLAAVVAVSLVTAGYSTYRSYRLKRAAEALDAAMQEQDSRRTHLQEVGARYSRTPVALWAELALARMDEEEDRVEEAIQRYQGIRRKLARQSALIPLVLKKLAALEEARDNGDAALGYYQELSGLDGFVAEAQLGMGRVYEAQGKRDEALARYQQFIQATAVSTGESGEDPRRQMMLSHIELLQEQ